MNSVYLWNNSNHYKNDSNSIIIKSSLMQIPSSLNSPQKKKIGLQDFQVKRIIGKGAYGDVFLVSKDNQLFAMKQIQKRKLRKQKKQYQALVQRQLLHRIRHAGIIKLRYAFQGKNKLFFVLEYCHLGEFVRFMKQYVQHFTQQVRKFYVAEIVNLLEYLHSNGITHRDLKPQNLLLSKQGHLKLIDFGTSQISQCKLLSQQFKQQIQKQKEKQLVSQGQDAVVQQPAPQPQQAMSPRKRRSTFVGTSYYISPQLLQQNICEPSSDLWALGCIVYQLYYLETPFKDTTEYGVFEKIKKVQLQFPKNCSISNEGRDLIERLLIKNPDQRLGSCSRQELDFKHLKAHPYFQGINIDKIYCTIPPDIAVKKFSLQNQQMRSCRLQDFKALAIKMLEQKQHRQQQQNKQEIIIQGLLQKRQFPYYEWCYLRIYSKGKIRQITLQSPQLVQQLQIYVQKEQAAYRVAQGIQISSDTFWIQLSDRSRVVFRCNQRQRWISGINQHQLVKTEAVIGQQQLNKTVRTETNK